MTTTKTISDNRINRDNNAKGYLALCTELVQGLGYDKNFADYDWSMSWNEFKTKAYRKDNKDVQVDVTLDFSNGSAIIIIDIIDEPERLSIDEEIEQWKARRNDEFGQVLREIAAQAFGDLFQEEDEWGLTSTPITQYIAGYAIDGNRQYTAKAVMSILEAYDVLEDVKALADKMKELAA